MVGQLRGGDAEQREERDDRLADAVAPAPSASLPAPAPALGFLRVSTRPWAYVEIDGRRLGITPLKHHPLEAGPHTLRLDNPGLSKTEVRELRIERDKTTHVVVDFIDAH